MFKHIFQRKPFAKEAASLYGTIVAQARDTRFYADLGVPDTVDGRFDMVVVHAWLVFRRLRELDQFDFSQALFDEMFADMDENLRRIGVGDMSVGKNVRRMAEALYGRMNAYDEGVAGGDRELIDVIRRNIYGTIEDPNGAWLAAMAGYIRRQLKSTSRISSAEMKAGDAGFTPVLLEAGE